LEVFVSGEQVDAAGTSSPGAEVVVDSGELHRRAKAWERQAATYQTEIAELRAKVAQLEPLAAELDPIKKAAEDYRGRFEALTLDVEKDRGLRAVGVAVDDPRAEALVKHWRREMAEAPEASRTGFDSWLGSARDVDPIVSALVSKPSAATATATTSTTATGPAGEPPRKAPDVGALAQEHGRLVRAGKLAEARAILDQINGMRR
jgi:hypothetical protein